MYSHLYLDNICDLMSEEIWTEGISRYDEFITCSKTHTPFPDKKKEESSKSQKREHEKCHSLYATH